MKHAVYERYFNGNKISLVIPVGRYFVNNFVDVKYLFWLLQTKYFSFYNFFKSGSFTLLWI